MQMAESIGLKIDISLTNNLKKVLSAIDTLNKNLAENTKQLIKNTDSLKGVTEGHKSMAEQANKAGEGLKKVNTQVKATTKTVGKLGKAQDAANASMGKARK